MLTDHFVHLKVDVSKGTDEDDELQDRYRAQTLPAVVFLDTGGTELGRVSRYLEPGEMLGVVKPAIARLNGEAVDGQPCVASASK